MALEKIIIQETEADESSFSVDTWNYITFKIESWEPEPEPSSKPRRMIFLVFHICIREEKIVKVLQDGEEAIRRNRRGRRRM